MAKIYYLNQNTSTANFKKKRIKAVSFLGIATSVFAVLSGINTIVIYNFYGISLNFFTYDVSNIFVPVLASTLTWCGLVGIPYILSFVNNKWHNVILKSFYIFFIYIVLMYFYAIDLFNIVMTNFLIRDSGITRIILLIIFLIGYIFAYFGAIKLINLRNEKLNYRKVKLGIFIFTFMCGVFFYALMVATTFINIFSFKIVEKTNYEIIEIEEKIVLYYSKNKVFVSDYTEKNGNVIIYTKNYKILDFNDIEFTNVEFESVSIDDENVKPVM